ncbi:MAG TPA: helix-turn-helix transcriptional regulator [Streptosporangiaceae bacterium]|jgi:transcriptional regulator with XRE-family HTH domain
MPSALRAPLQWDPGEPLGTLIQRARTWSGKSQHALAAQLSEQSGTTAITRATISHWETDRHIPSPYWRGYLSKVLGIPLDVLDRAAAVPPASQPQPPGHGNCAAPPADPPAENPPPTRPGTAVPEQQPAITETAGPEPGMVAARAAPGLMLTTAQTLTLLSITPHELASLIATGLLRPCGSDGPGARRYPASQIEELLNTPGGIPRDARPGLLHALCQALPACAGPGLDCQLHRHGQHPHLLIRADAGAQLTVWLLWTSAGWRFYWGQGRSHDAIDVRGAATAIAAGLAPASTATGP